MLSHDNDAGGHDQCDLLLMAGEVVLVSWCGAFLLQGKLAQVKDHAGGDWYKLKVR